MNARQMREFITVGIVAGVIIEKADDFAEVSESGIICVPDGVVPTGFNLAVAVPEDGDDSRVFVAQKEVGVTGGAYTSSALSAIEGFAPGFKTTIMSDAIEVIRAGKNVWTGWHKNAASNRVDCWHLGVDGRLVLFQVGVKTNDNGQSWKLHGEDRWVGQLYRRADGSLVGKPDHPRWGSLEGGTSKRMQIFTHPEFQTLLKTATLPTWDGKPEDIESTLKKAPMGFATVQWYISFAGQAGQGIAILSDGRPVWAHGPEIRGVNSDPDGEVRLWRNDIISYERVVENWGSKGKSGPPKLTGVKLVDREWIG